MADSGYALVGKVEQSNEDYVRQLEAEAKKKEKGIYPRTIFIGVGGTGSKALLHLRRLTLERFGAVHALEGIAYLSIDTDIRSQDVSAEEEKKNPLDQALSFERDERINVKIDFKNYVGPNIIHHPQIREWWDESALPRDDFQLDKGAGQIRPLSRLAFFTNKPTIQEGVRRAYSKVSTNRILGERVDMESPIRVVIIAGLAGGTGSGMVLDLPALVQAELQNYEKPVLEGFFVLPGSFGTVEKDQNYPKLAANGFAALRELNHYLTHPFEVQWEPAGTRVEIRGLYKRYVLFSGTNASGEQLGDLTDCYRTIGETLFLDFGAGPMAGWIQGVRVNREQYLRSAVTYTYRLPQADGSVRETHTDEWRNTFASIGISKLVVPSWRLINQAKYQLAAEMVKLLDPGREGELKDLITNHRDRFVFDCGFFQGDREDEEGRRSHWQIRDRLARQTGAGTDITSIFEHIAKFERELAELAESMYTEGNTIEECDGVWKRVANLWGDPTSAGAEGDWARLVRQNREGLIREVHERLPQVVEDYRRKPAVGISGVTTLLRNILETLDRPADQARYTDYFKQERVRLAGRIKELSELWTRRVRNADRASRGFGRKAESHHLAVALAGETLQEYWGCRVRDLICEEGEKALNGIRDSLRQRLTRIEGIADRMRALEAEYGLLADFYKQPQRSVVIREIDIAGMGEDLLEDYLGRQPEERRRKLGRLLDRGLRQMGLDTLEAIGQKLAGELGRFRDNLAAQAFYALRGENGKTSAFGETADETQVGFIEKHSVFESLKKLNDETKRRELFDQLYRKGLPWARRNQVDPLASLHEPHVDAFVGCIADANPPLALEMLTRLQKVADNRYAPMQVRSYDPAEIIFYTEINAYPIYYLSELTSLRGYYDTLMGDTTKRTPLHVHQDYHKYQPLIPFSTGEVASLQRAWNLFLQAQMLGLVCSLRQRAEDDRRVAYQWRRQVGPFELQWTDLGPEGEVIRRLMKDESIVRQLQRDIETRQKEFLETPRGNWTYLIALADYYYYCAFPVRSTTMTVGAQPLGSMENLVVLAMRQEWRSKAGAAADFDLQIKGRMESLGDWARPVSRDRGQIVPWTEALRPEERLEEWRLLPAAEAAIASFLEGSLLLEQRDAQGNRLTIFPRLALHWPYFEEVASKPEGALSAELWHYAGDRGQEKGLTASEVAARVARNTSGKHRVWAEGLSNWRDAREVPAIAQLLGQATLLTAGAAVPPPDVEASPEPPPLAAPPPLSPAPPKPEAVLYHYARDGQKLGAQTAADVARLVAEHPESEHKVWTSTFGTTWKQAREVPEIQALMAAEPPPLD